MSLIWFLPGYVFAQSGFSAGITTSIDWSKPVPFIATTYNKGGLGYSAGLRTRYDFTGWFNIQTGLTFVSTRYVAEQNGLAHLDQFSTFPYMNTAKYKAVADIQSFQIPVLLSFYFGNRLRAGFTVGSGLNYAYRCNREVTWYFDESEYQTRSTNRVDDRNVFGSFIAGIGCEYSIGKFIVRMEPTAQYSFLPRGNNVKNHPHSDPRNDRYTYWSLGMGISSLYRF